MLSALKHYEKRCTFSSKSIYAGEQGNLLASADRGKRNDIVVSHILSSKHWRSYKRNDSVRNLQNSGHLNIYAKVSRLWQTIWFTQINHNHLIYVMFIIIINLPSVLRRCWLGDRKGIRSLKTEWWGTGMAICLERGANYLHMVQLMPLPPHHLLLQ